MKIPELLTSVNGEKIDTVEKWENKRREEIMDLFSEYVYGVRPVERPDDIAFCVEREDNYLGYGVTKKTVSITFSGYTMKVYGFQPANITGKIPAIVYAMHEYEEERCNVVTDMVCEFVDIKEITRRGYAAFIMFTSCIAPDWEAKCEYKAGVYPLYDKERDEKSWATISAWSWGTSRVLDYIETDDELDATKVAVSGHSRGGKTALWAGATDPRFFVAYSNSSGCTGAAVLRGKKGEHIKDINITDWFCGNYHKFDDNEDALPVDQHMLIAAQAPRNCYIQSCSLDEWADPKAERLACRLANEAYALYGKTGIVLPEEGKVENDTAYHEGTIGYHMRSGSHCIIYEDWRHFLDFFDKKLGK